VNEAICARLPVVVCREGGCVADLVQDGVNGYTPAAGNVAGLAHAVQGLIEDEGLRRANPAVWLPAVLGGYQQCLEAFTPRWRV
jgi:glycosyltransferase involved in cell wall biosynthesis